ncbi:Hydrolyzes the sphingolipid ceramide into sphingosine and free fatty acid [Desmophyllum pertusum]|uniref:Alkaline ceramidase n=1 Tax=Desmophyllum pertusum TaxID=174260 RepID=A0A9W9ZWT7_9CNID|nr:Hydrolyzes the sphingolipid ceramide into sphingosine and free fatty acid [Desmophyllum pertusum]
MLESFARGSSDIDWCESNYVYVPFIAEFYNTVSNAIFFILPPFFMYLFRPYSRHVSSGVNIIWVLFVVVGASSAYFHATLSLVGQLLDELSILWGLMAGFALWTPKWLLAFGPFGEDRKKFQYTMLALSLICTWLGFVYPVANAFVLMVVGTPFPFMLFAEMKSSNNSRIKRLGKVGTVWWILAVLFWINDRAFCDIWRSVSFPYLHCAWHIMICIAIYIGCVLGSYFYVETELPQLRPTLSFWPSWSSGWGIPYIALKGMPKEGIA